MERRGKYQVPEKVRYGKHRRRVSHALGNSPVSGYAEELGGAEIRVRGIIFAAFVIFAAVGLYFVVF